MRKGPPTLSDVARLAGVSEITVSRVVRNKGSISPKTRDVVAAAIEKLGYLPNRAAGALASANSALIAVLLPSLSNVVFPEVLRGINEGLKDTRYQPLIGVTEYNPILEEQLLFSLLAWKPRAVITTGFEHTSNALRMLATSTVRVAELMDIDSQPIDVAVGLSHRRAGYATGRHLIQRGYQRFGYVGHNWHKDVRAKLRLDGLQAALQDAGKTVSDMEFSDGPSSTETGKAMLETLLKRKRQLDVVVFSNDDMAVGGFFHCMSSSIAVKRDLALFGFNGLEIGQSLPMPLSTVRSNRFMIGKRAVEILLANDERPSSKTVVDTGFEIVEGETA
ncbi:LacI family DNA-binding transcriptional regulator [Mesorhizobium sp. VNQ89]|uniref:LacI family DNA-binding transcriptional regulator n=1 Tax=Mesorhizobium quangtriensis TaxID=3157709 RepID=UPI0032B70451